VYGYPIVSGPQVAMLVRAAETAVFLDKADFVINGL
jgi:hypothetical protein